MQPFGIQRRRKKEAWNHCRKNWTKNPFFIIEGSGWGGGEPLNAKRETLQATEKNLNTNCGEKAAKVESETTKGRHLLFFYRARTPKSGVLIFYCFRTKHCESKRRTSKQMNIKLSNERHPARIHRAGCGRGGLRVTEYIVSSHFDAQLKTRAGGKHARTHTHTPA